MKTELVPAAVWGLMCLSAVASPAAVNGNGLPPSACFSDYLESKDGFYATVDGGAVFFNGPVKDQSNIYRGYGGAPFNLPATDHPVGPSDTSDTTGSVGGTFGYVLSRHPEESWLGTNLRAEAGGDYLQTSASSSQSVSASPTNYVSIGRLDGQNFTDSFSLVNNPFIAVGNAAVPVANIKFDSHDELYDAKVVLKSDYCVAQGAFVFTPEVGVGFARIEQRSSTDLSGSTTTQPTYANEQESINANYYGAILGFELKANVSKSFVPFFSVVSTLGYAQAGYFGAQEYSSNFNIASINNNDSVSNNAGDFFAREQISAGYLLRLRAGDSQGCRRRRLLEQRPDRAGTDGGERHVGGESQLQRSRGAFGGDFDGQSRGPRDGHRSVLRNRFLSGNRRLISGLGFLLPAAISSF